MSGLDAAIRGEIDHAVQEIKGCDPDTFTAIAADELRAALTAVLDVHVTADLGDGKPYCAECSDRAGVRVFEPCRTKQAIAKELGVVVAP